MDHLLNNLNRLTEDTPDAMTTTTKELALRYSRSQEHAPLFNYASMAHNHHFFFEGIRTGHEDQTELKATLLHPLQRSLLADFQAMDHLREDFLNTAEAMFGPGFVWLVRARLPLAAGAYEHRWRILTTYLAGTPYHQAHARRQPSDMNVIQDVRAFARAGGSKMDLKSRFQVSNNVAAFGSTAGRSEAAKLAEAGGVEVIPVLCVSTWEHVWLHQFGVGGKTKFLEAFWDRINWAMVGERTNMAWQDENKAGNGSSSQRSRR